ncbi:hypothetical protein Q8W25_03750 [Shimia thalassica]|jgi:hypothetical protein|uniref:Uncharacterized protein n=1 Tax=Shimia thalassica TaxID=1715693 RepID=A0A0P1IDD3_9RHOB|nr:hypothetical protein [Shimia thalassica]MDO6481240.1 hypothetical protein [Shimia thalassica]MDP2493113.1 hypothetical protein [Shimia thalassica]CUK06816.1 hypothetical protein PH7735_03072 [Shimia thalassica]
MQALKPALPVILAAIVMALVVVFDVPTSFGAHPWWSTKSVLIGAPIGIVIAVLATRLTISAMVRRITFAVAVVAAFGVAKYGGEQFAASYAEDAFAGKLWFFGWIATSAAVAAWLVTLFQTMLDKSPVKSD